MTLVAPSIMSTTTCLQFEELQKKPTTFHRHILSETRHDVSDTVKRESQVDVSKDLETRQKVLLLNGPREQYTLVDDHNVPSVLYPGEILVKVRSLCINSTLHGHAMSNGHLQVLAIGLNPIDWKAPYVVFCCVPQNIDH